MGTNEVLSFREEMHKGDSIQATFWELRKEDIKKVRFFTAASPKPKYLEVEE